MTDTEIESDETIIPGPPVPFVNKVTYRGMIAGVGERTHNALFDGDDADSMDLYVSLYGMGDFQVISGRLRKTYFEIIDKDSGEKILTQEKMPIPDEAPTVEWPTLGYNRIVDGDFLQFSTVRDKNGYDKVVVTVPEELFRTLCGDYGLRICSGLLVRYEVTLELAWHYLPESSDFVPDQLG